MPPPGEAYILGVNAVKPVERHGLEAIKYAFWDPQKRTILGRTSKSWFLILLFYLIYYTFLAAFWALMMYIFLTTIKTDTPKYTASESLIGQSPGLGLRPSQPDEYISSSMIIFNKDSELGTRYVLGWDTWKEQIDHFLGKNYNNKGLKSCAPNTRAGDYNRQACRFDLTKLGPCANSKTAYGYSEGKPCVYFKLNRIFGVENHPYNGTGYFPDDMPKELQNHISSQPNKNQVWVHCEGENPADIEDIGPIKYYPKHKGLSSEYFPYLNQRPYESPLVAIQFLNPPIGRLLHIECRAWARNIKYSRMHRMGMVRFELFVLDNKTAKLYEKSLK